MCDEAVGDDILEVAVSKRWLVICPLEQGSQAGGSISTTFAQTVCGYSDTRILSGVGVNSSCKDVSTSDACMVFGAEGCQVVPNETSILPSVPSM